MNKQNVILIVTDGVRRDRILNFENFSKLSKRGCFFPKVVSYAPYTIASLYSVFTGIYGNRNGVDNYYGRFQFKKDQCKTLTSYLKDAGYYTIGDILNEVVVPNVGFQDLTIQTPDKDILPRHRDILRKCGSLKKSGKKFFAFLHCGYVHNSLVRDVIKIYDDVSPEFFKNTQKNIKRYDSYLQEVEDYLDTIFKDIKRENIEDSIVIIFSDHGCSAGERIGEKVYGSFCYDYTIMTFGIFLHDEIFPVKTITSLARTVDFMPTIMDFLQLPLDENKMKLDGKSLITLVNGSESSFRIGFCETGGLGGPYPSPKSPNVHCVRTDKWKLIFNHTPKTYELYEMEDDPKEKNNLYGQKGFEEIQKLLLKELRRKLIKAKF